VKKIQESAQRLAQERYILKDDAPAIVQEAGRHWDSLMIPATRTSQGARSRHPLNWPPGSFGSYTSFAPSVFRKVTTSTSRNADCAQSSGVTDVTPW
jgi:hypothetical protein